MPARYQSFGDEVRRVICRRLKKGTRKLHQGPRRRLSCPLYTLQKPLNVPQSRVKARMHGTVRASITGNTSETADVCF